MYILETLQGKGLLFYAHSKSNPVAGYSDGGAAGRRITRGIDLAVFRLRQ